MTVRILQGDCRDVLATLPADSVHCCITSPPYWGLRDYGVSGQIGLESTFTEFIAEMVKVFREVRRVLRPDGTLWLNLGDSYVSGGGTGHQGKHGDRCNRSHTQRSLLNNVPEASGLKPKDLCGIPWRVALALQEDGWWLRQDIIWSKPNPMPESVTDRCTKSHEYIFLLTKQARYYFDAEAIKEESTASDESKARYAYGRYEGEGGAKRFERSGKPDFLTKDGNNYGAATRNRRSVWEIATSPFPAAHFATYPPALVEPCIKAGTSQKGCCGKCGAPWVREVERQTLRHLSNEAGTRAERPKAAAYGEAARSTQQRDKTSGLSPSNSHNETTPTSPQVKTIGWSPSCQCNADVVPCTVLDPFGGAGTTALVADRQQRNAISIELNPEYVELQKRRVFNDSPLFAGI